VSGEEAPDRAAEMRGGGERVAHRLLLRGISYVVHLALESISAGVLHRLLAVSRVCSRKFWFQVGCVL
jgi:hypothetical protein